MRTNAARLRAALRAVLALSLAAEANACDSSNEGAPAARDASAPVDACAPIPHGVIYFPEAGTNDAGNPCQQLQVELPCGLPYDPALLACQPGVDYCNSVCPKGGLLAPCMYDETSCMPLPDGGALFVDASLVVDCPTCLGNLGRRPRGLAPYDGTKSGSAVGDWLAGAAFLEAASVRAFRDLSRALGSFGAPRSLVRACARAEADERAHARSTARMARRFGAAARRPRVRASGAGAPSLEALLTENVTEGCVRETYGALVAMHQAELARDERLARHARAIAIDEARHAALAWRVHEWGMARLGPRARRRVVRARDRAIRALREETRVAAPRDVILVAGVPTPRVAHALVERFTREVVGA